jgi:hypothetical protein
VKPVAGVLREPEAVAGGPGGRVGQPAGGHHHGLGGEKAAVVQKNALDPAVLDREARDTGPEKIRAPSRFSSDSSAPVTSLA